MLQRISWAAVLTGLLSLLALLAAMVKETDLVLGFGLSAVAWAILSLKDRT